MDHRTHPTQQDEALRQTRLDDTIRAGLRQIADELANDRPGHLMTAEQRHASALTYADTTHPNDEHAAFDLERELLCRMPWTDGRTVTRGEYALWLHKTSWSA